MRQLTLSASLFVRFAVTLGLVVLPILGVHVVSAAAVVSAVSSSNISSSSATITWATDIPATTQVEFGPTTAYGVTTANDRALVTFHSVTIAALTGSSTYHYHVLSADAAHNRSVSSDASFSTGAANPMSASVGEWSPVVTWPLVAVHAALLYTGEVVTWDAWETNGTVSATVWNPSTQSFAGVPLASLIFCSGHVELADGRLLVSGGHGLNATLGTPDTNIFDPATRTWTVGPKMASARWYPAVTKLSDGRVLSLSGQITQQSWADIPEIFSPTTNAWSKIGGVSTSGVQDDEYPLDFLLPSGKVFNITPNVGETNVLDVGAASWNSSGLPALSSRNGSAAMYRPGKILYTGGGNLGGASVTSSTVIDLTQPTPTKHQVAPMSLARYEHNLTVLPDGQVLTVGGVKTVDQTVQNGSQAAELFDPNTETWSTMATEHDVRQYHSTSLLLPDGRVLSAGGGRWASATDYLTEETYSPPYLFKGPRPNVTNAPTSAAYGSTMQVDTPDSASIARVSLTNLASDTHTSDMDQHYLELPFTVDGTGLSVQAPTSSTMTPAGYYMLWLISSQGVPSFARIVQITGASQSDTQPPSISISQPSAGASLTGSVGVSASATDNVGVTGVQFLLDGKPLGALLATPPYTLTWDTTNATNGTHALSATASDLAGNTGSASAMSVSVANADTPPKISAVSAQNVTGSGATIAWTTDKPADSQVQYGTTATYGTSTSVNPTLTLNHSVTLSGLALNTTYHYQATSRDASGTPGVSADATFTTSASAPVRLVGDQTLEASPDTDPAGLAEAFQYTAAATGSASQLALYLDGDNQATSVVVGVYANSGSNSPGTLLAQSTIAKPTAGAWNTVVIPSVAITSGTKYWIAVLAPAGTGNLTVRDRTSGSASQGSSASTLATLPASWSSGGSWPTSSMSAYLTGISSSDTQPPSVGLTGPSSGATVSGSVSVSATASDNVGVTSVQFTLDGFNLGSAVLASPYSVTWDTTTATNGSHTLAARAQDAAGNIAASTGVGVTVSNTDITPPVLSSPVATTMLPTGAVISWTTNEPADSQVQYGTTASYGSSTAVNSALATTHSQGLSGLTPATTYFCQLLSRDAAGNQGTTTLGFTTPALAASAIAARSVTANSATIAWTTNEATTSQVEYGTSLGYGSSTAVDPSLGLSHSVVVAGLTAGTTYHYRVKGTDSAGYGLISADASFKTSPAAPIAYVGDTKVETAVDANQDGSAEAFQYTATTTGAITSLSVYIDAHSTASQVVVGLYTSVTSTNNPGALLVQALITNPVAGTWNAVSVPSTNVTSGTKYWLAILAPNGAGIVQFRDVASGGRTQGSSQTNLTTLPAIWSPGTTWPNSPMSAFASP